MGSKKRWRSLVIEKFDNCLDWLWSKPGKFWCSGFASINNLRLEKNTASKSVQFNWYETLNYRSWRFHKSSFCKLRNRSYLQFSLFQRHEKLLLFVFCFFIVSYALLCSVFQYFCLKPMNNSPRAVSTSAGFPPSPVSDYFVHSTLPLSDTFHDDSMQVDQVFHPAGMK